MFKFDWIQPNTFKIIYTFLWKVNEVLNSQDISNRPIYNLIFKLTRRKTMPQFITVIHSKRLQLN